MGGHGWLRLLLGLVLLGGPARAGVRIAEFMAANSETLADEEGEFPDWIEIENTGPDAVNLAGWVLTDKPDGPGWVFPATNLLAGERLVVFASNQDRRRPGAPLHTNFRLSAAGEYLALRSPAGEAVSELAPAFPPQAPDVSFGLGRQAESRLLVGPDTPALVRVPETAADRPADWPPAVAPDWPVRPAAVGYEASPADYATLIRTDLRAAMRHGNTTCLLLIPFAVADPAQLTDLQLGVRFDDGFVAWLNGVEVGSRNAPGELAWNSAATRNHPDAQAVIPEELDLSAFRHLLHPGTNWLAFQGLNVSPNSSDFLLVPELRTTRVSGGDAAWRYFTHPTPGEPNGGGSEAVGPLVRSLRHAPESPARLRADEDLRVQARVTAAFAPVAGVTLHYRVNFAPESTVPMRDDGASEDGEAGDGIFGARIPAAAFGPGDLVRYRVTATDTEGATSRFPLFLPPDNAPEYQGTVVQDPAVESACPIWEWFTANPAAARTRGGARGDVFFAGRLYDNVFIRARGGATSGGSQKFDFNTGDHLFVNDTVGRVEEANLNTRGSDSSWVRVPLAFQAFRMTGHPACEAFHVQMRLNGAPDRLGIFIEQVDKRFLRRNGLDPRGALYKFVQRRHTTPVFSDAAEGIEKKTRKEEDWSDLEAFVAGLNAPDPEARRRWFFDHVDVPGLLNYLAVRWVIQDADDVRKNFYLYRDTRGSGEWTIFPWDKDWTFGVSGDGGPDLRHPFFGDYAHRKPNANQWNVLWEFVFNDPVVRPLYLRRLRGVGDALLEPRAELDGEAALVVAARSYLPALTRELGGSIASRVNSVLQFLERRRNDLDVTYSVANPAAGANALIPLTQPADALPELGAVEFNPASGNQAEEFLRLDNPHPFALDLSDWRLDGAIRHTFRPGTVIPAEGSLFLSPDVRAFRARAVSPHGGEGRLAQGDYAGRLSARGETIQLRDPADEIRAEWSYPGDPTPAQRWLRITELMFHPRPVAGVDDPEALEFIELKNLGPEPLDLRGVRFTRGIEFAFPTDAPVLLAPGEAAVLARDEAAFRAAYGPTPRLLGRYAGQLDNGGETVRLEDAAGEKVLEFRYHDDWQPTADGQGDSLVVRDETAPWTAWDTPEQWQASAELGGSPGAPEPSLWQDTDGDGMPDVWERRHGLNPGVKDGGDDADHDGLSNLREFFAGTDPRDAASVLRLAFEFLPDGRLRLRFTALPDRVYRLSRSTNLAAGAWETRREFSGLSGAQSLMERPPADAPACFYRLEVVAVP